MANKKMSNSKRSGMAKTREYAKARKTMDVSLSAKPVKKGSMSKKAEAQRRGMAATRAKAQKKQPTPAQRKILADREKQRRLDQLGMMTQQRFIY